MDVSAENRDNRVRQAAPAPDLAVVIPALDERENLSFLIPALQRELATLGVTAEIIVVDGGPPEGVQTLAHPLGVRVVGQSQPGYGSALLTGFAATAAPYIITMDADLSHPPAFIAEMWRSRHKAHVLIASRYVAGSQAEMNPWRKFLSKVLNTTYSRLLSLPFKDLSSGFRMYRADALRALQPKSRDFDVLEEILIKVYTEGWSIAEMPFRYRSRVLGKTRSKLLHFGMAYLRTLRRMWQLRNSVESADYDYRAFNSPIWLQRYWQRKRHEIILNFTGGATSVLDIGCGSSRIILDLKDAVGMDILQRKLRWLKPKHDLLVNGSTFALPFKDQRFDAVINSEVIEHVPADPEILNEMWRVLRPGGTMILGTPDYGRWSWVALEWIYGKVLPGAYAHEHITHYTRESLAKLVRDRGFELLDCQYVGYSEMIFKARKPAGVSGVRQASYPEAEVASVSVRDNAQDSR